jgi:hypothetical protein
MNRRGSPNVLRLICILVVAVGGAAQPLPGEPVDGPRLSESARVIYVDDDAAGANNGSSWADAFNYLQDALAQAAVAAKPVEVRVAQGNYKPDQGAGMTPGDQTASFRLLNGVTLNGGYAGVTAPEPDARDVDLYETILNGDLAGNGSNDFPGGADDSCHVVTGSLTDSTAVMDGLTITAGNWPSSFLCGFQRGSTARVFIDAGSPMIRDCRFMDVRGFGAEAVVFLCNRSAPTFIGCVFSGNENGMHSVESSPTLLHCLFAGNTWEAMDCAGDGAPSLTDCRFESNATGIKGSGNVSLTLADCTFVDNSTAMSVWSGTVSATNCIFERNRQAVGLTSGSLRLTRCRFDGNTSGAVDGAGDISLTQCSFTGNSGGLAAAIEAFSSVTASDCTFTANTGLVAGAILGGKILTLRNCEFSGNVGRLAGAVDMDGDVLKATGCLFTGNSSERAGALYSGAALFSLSNCTFSDNRGLVNAIRHYKPGPVCPAEVTQCIIWDGPAAVLEESSTASPITVAYSNVQGGYTGEGNIDVDPYFVAPGHWADPNDPSVVLRPEDPDAVWVPGDYHLMSQAGHWDREGADWVQDEATSPCIDAGDPNGPMGAEPFPNGGIVNLGGYGGTAEASRSYFGGPVCERQIAGDINGDCVVDATDMEILTSHWLLQGWPTSDLPPTITITQPIDGDEFHGTAPMSVRADATDPDGFVIRVAFRMEYRGETINRGSGSTDADPSDGWGCEWQWSSRVSTEPQEIWTIWGEAMDNDGNITVSPKIKVTLHVTN